MSTNPRDFLNAMALRIPGTTGTNSTNVITIQGNPGPQGSTGPSYNIATGLTPPSVTGSDKLWFNTNTSQGKMYVLFDGTWVGL